MRIASTSGLMKETRLEFPDFEFSFKDESRLMKVLDVLLKIVSLGTMRTFMTDFTTTIGYMVYAPRAAWLRIGQVGQCVVLRHERVHMRQRQKLGMILYSLLYLLLPLPGGLAYFRMRFEKEAYEESIGAVLDYGCDPMDPRIRGPILASFLGSQYLFMWPFRRNIEAWYQGAVDSVTRP